MLSDTPEPNWDGLPLAQVIDLLYDDAVLRARERRPRQYHLDDRNRVVILRNARNPWWAVHGSVVGEIAPLRPDILRGSNYDTPWLRPIPALRDAFARLLPELRAGTVVVEAEGDHTVNYQIMEVPVGFWRAANWICYREPPKLVAVDRSSFEALPPVYSNPRLRFRRRVAAAQAPRAVPETRHWTETQIRPPNMNRVEGLIRQRLPGAKRARIRPVITEPEFANLRRRSGEKRNK
jgi:hypothetical protein